MIAFLLILLLASAVAICFLIFKAQRRSLEAQRRLRQPGQRTLKRALWTLRDPRLEDLARGQDLRELWVARDRILRAYVAVAILLLVNAAVALLVLSSINESQNAQVKRAREIAQTLAGLAAAERSESLQKAKIRLGMALRDGEVWGVTVDFVSSSSSYFESGLRAGDTIVQFDGTNISSPSDWARVRTALKESKGPHDLVVHRSGQPQKLISVGPN